MGFSLFKSRNTLPKVDNCILTQYLWTDLVISSVTSVQLRGINTSCFQTNQDFTFWYNHAQQIIIYRHYHKAASAFYKGMLTTEISSACADSQQALTEVTGSLKNDAASSVHISDTHTKIQKSLPHPKRSPETVLLEKQRQGSEKSNTTRPF